MNKPSLDFVIINILYTMKSYLALLKQCFTAFRDWRHFEKERWFEKE